MSCVRVMSRLDSFIRRISAQRDILNDLSNRLDPVPGPIYEFGLGNGRTFDHLRELFPGRRIVVFERVVGEHSQSRPSQADLVIGDLRETAMTFPEGGAALIHSDIETGSPESDLEVTKWLPGLVAHLLAPGGFAASGGPLPDPRLISFPLPSGIAEGRYHVVRRI